MLTSARIQNDRVMVDRFSDLTNVYPIRSISQEETLAGKESFYRQAATFGVKIKIYNADNGRFAEQPFISFIINANHTILLFGVGYHHQNKYFERKTQTLTLEAITLLLFAKRYLPESITTMLWPYALKDISEQLNLLKLNGGGINLMDKFSGTMT